MRLRSVLLPGTMYSDSKKAESLAARLVDPVIRRRDNSDSDEDDDAIFAELEAEIENGDEYARETAIQAIKKEYVHVRVTPSLAHSFILIRMEKVDDLRKSEHGTYTEIMDEKEVIRITSYEFALSLTR
jgi:hypothetical protein